MRNEFTAVVERDGRWHIAYSPEIPGANGQGRTKAEALKSLANAIALILEDRRKDGLRSVPASARREKVVTRSAAGCLYPRLAGSTPTFRSQPTAACVSRRG